MKNFKKTLMRLMLLKIRRKLDSKIMGRGFLGMFSIEINRSPE
jgi:hypothetical protein